MLGHFLVVRAGILLLHTAVQPVADPVEEGDARVEDGVADCYAGGEGGDGRETDYGFTGAYC